MSEWATNRFWSYTSFYGIHYTDRFQIVIHLCSLHSAFSSSTQLSPQSRKTGCTFLVRQTGLTWGNLSSHLGKLEAAGYLAIKKEFLGKKKPHTMLRLTDEGRAAFHQYRQSMKQVLNGLPDQ